MGLTPSHSLRLLAGRTAALRGWLWKSTSGLVAAPRCLLCLGATAAATPVCNGCRDDLPQNSPACPRCAQPLLGAPRLCAACGRSAPPFEAAMAAFRYRNPVNIAIQRLKYSADFGQIGWLTDALAAQLAAHLGARPEPAPELLIPVPLHAQRLRHRGYNQATEIARRLGRSLEIPVAPEAARRVRMTADQIGKTRIERRRNLRGAFEATAAVRGRRIALIDDVMTTGSTVTELARACRRAGAVRIEIWVLARAE